MPYEFAEMQNYARARIIETIECRIHSLHSEPRNNANNLIDGINLQLLLF